MKTLNEIYQNNSQEFRREIESTTSVLNICNIIQERVQSLADINGEYIGGLTKPEARVAISMLEAFRFSVSLMAKSCIPTESTYQTVDDSHKRQSHGNTNPLNGQLRIAAGAILGGTIGGALEGAFVGGPVGGPVGAIAGAAIGATTATVLSVSGQGSESFSEKAEGGSAGPLEHEQPVAAIDKGELLSYFEQTLYAIDQAVSEYGQLSEPIEHKPKLEEHIDVLELIQDILGEIGSNNDKLPPSLKLKQREISSILHRYDIHIQDYREDISDEVGRYFDIEPSLDANLEDTLVLKPALLREGKVILRGCVIKP